MRRALAAALGYLLGSIMVAPRVARRHGVDLYGTADGNPGAWNALEQLGLARAWPAFAGDGLKAALAAALGRALGGWPAGFAGAAGAIIGHALPVGEPRRGGKGVMCLVGGMLVLAPLSWFAALGVCVGVARFRGFASGARAGMVALPVVQLLTGPVGRVKATGVLMSLVGVAFLRPGHNRARATDARATAPSA
jgi:glycerol-3-phosphate acyltransferase PlsY